ncbi:MAG TPA: thrombospondin type 3 repeat-containing protein, partial [Candidatus Nanoarchaeia archaeon]|nr:thrombospondin type 3 repeat-containing protein [Candidatus Nanoarchaeia archaeon]
MVKINIRDSSKKYKKFMPKNFNAILIIGVVLVVAVIISTQGFRNYGSAIQTLSQEEADAQLQSYAQNLRLTEDTLPANADVTTVEEEGFTALAFDPGESLNINNFEYPTQQSVAFWVKSSADGPIVDYNAGEFIISIETDTVKVSHNTGAEIAKAVRPNTWEHVTIVQDGQQLQLYVNGDVPATAAFPSSSNTGEFRIGGTSFAGLIDDVVLYDTQLDGEILFSAYGGLRDSDSDGIVDIADNCPAISNENQIDADADGRGDACDNCPDSQNFEQQDNDNDGVGNACDTDDDNDQWQDSVDLCPFSPQSTSGPQLDNDGDGRGNACDICEDVANSLQEDFDNDAVGDVCDVCPLDFHNDEDLDNVCGNIDNCPVAANPNQEDA